MERVFDLPEPILQAWRLCRREDPAESSNSPMKLRISDIHNEGASDRGPERSDGIRG